MLYEITVTLRPCLYRFTAAEQFDKTEDKLRLILCLYKSSCIAELTKEHNIHYHGIIDLKDVSEKDRLCNRFRKYNKEFGRKSIDQIRYENSYRKYIVKEFSTTQKIIGKLPIITNDLKLLGVPIDEMIKEDQTPTASEQEQKPSMKPRKKNNYIN